MNFVKTLELFGLGVVVVELVDYVDCGQHCGQRTADTQIRKFCYVSAFSTLVENADILENAQEIRKNVRIRKFLTCPHFPP